MPYRHLSDDGPRGPVEYGVVSDRGPSELKIHISDGMTEANARAIAAVPKLLAEVTRLRAVEAELRGSLHKIAHDHLGSTLVSAYECARHIARIAIARGAA